MLVAVSLVLYALGAKFLLVPALLAANVLWLPMPRIFRSWVSRLALAFILLLGLLQLAATLQFLLVPKSGFIALAVLVGLVQVAVLWVAPERQDKTEKWVSVNDVYALAIFVFFLLPFVAPMVAGSRTIERIAEIGGIQAIDSTNHYAYIAETTDKQHYDYEPGKYYPKGFHLAVGFVQHSFFGRQGDLSWQNNALLFFWQYVVYAGLLAYVVFLLLMSWLEPLVQRRLHGMRALAALTLGLPFLVFYLIPFVPEGFLNYYYVCATVVCGFLFLGELNTRLKREDDPEALLSRSKGVQWWLVGYLLLAFGAISSWPLLLPPLVLTAVLFVLPATWRRLAFWQKLWDRRVIVLVLAFVLQLIPLYFQFRYSSIEGSQGLNAQGGLRIFHPFVLLAGFLLISWVVLYKRIDEPRRRLVFNIFMPLAGFIGLLTILHYFFLGEIRYYTIKSSLLLEMLMLVLAVLAVVYAFAQSGWRGAKYAVFVAAIPLIAMIFLVSTAQNPLKDDRDIFRSVSQQPKPPHFDRDIQVYTELGRSGKIKQFNSTLLHVDQENGKYVAHMQIPYWMNMMQYKATTDEREALRCSGQLYANLGFGNFTPQEQQKLVDTIKACAKLARSHYLTYYLVTDEASAPQLQREFGDVATIVY